VQGELGQFLGYQGDQAGVVRPWRNLAEPHLVALDEQFDAEQPATTERLGHRQRHALGLGLRLRAHRLRLPGLLIVTILLTVANRRAEAGAAGVAHGKQGDLVVEVDKPFHDDPALAGAPALLGIVPGALQVGVALQHALALAGRTHDRLDHAGVTDGFHRRGVVLEGVGEMVGRSGQAQLLGGQATDALAVHGQLCGACGGHHVEALGLQLDQGGGGDGLDLGHDEMRLLGLDHRTQGGAVEHVDHVAAVRHLHGRGVGVTVHAYHLAAQALQLDHHFLAELAAAAQQHAGRGRRQGGSNTGHEGLLEQRIRKASADDRRRGHAADRVATPHAARRCPCGPSG
jgi:hypothetical protein